MIIANFPAGITGITIPALKQWDYNQRLAIYGLDLPATVQVHFCTKVCEEATIRLAYRQEDGHSEVDIPNNLLQEKHDIHAFLFINSYEEALDVESTSEGTYYTRSGVAPNYAYSPVDLPAGYVPGTTYYVQCGKIIREIFIPIDARVQPAEYVDPGDPTHEELMAELANYCNALGARVAEYRTFSDIRILTKDQFNALATKEEGVIYAFSDDNTLEEIDAYLTGTKAVPKADFAWEARYISGIFGTKLRILNGVYQIIATYVRPGIGDLELDPIEISDTLRVNSSCPVIYGHLQVAGVNQIMPGGGVFAYYIKLEKADSGFFEIKVYSVDVTNVLETDITSFCNISWREM